MARKWTILLTNGQTIYSHPNDEVTITSEGRVLIKVYDSYGQLIRERAIAPHAWSEALYE